jgi:membrane protein YqaA with SNARE-associated domain
VVGGVDALLIAIAISSPAQAYLAALCAFVGSLIGSAVLFAIARKGGEVLLARHISGKRGARLHAWFERYGLITVFIPALSPLPMPMKVPVFCAGALEVRWSYFLSVVAAARFIRYTALAYLGSRYGSATFLILKTHWPIVVGVALTLAIAALAILQIAERRSNATGSVKASHIS